MDAEGDFNHMVENLCSLLGSSYILPILLHRVQPSLSPFFGDPQIYMYFILCFLQKYFIQILTLR